MPSKKHHVSIILAFRKYQEIQWKVELYLISDIEKEK